MTHTCSTALTFVLIVTRFTLQQTPSASNRLTHTHATPGFWIISPSLSVVCSLPNQLQYSLRRGAVLIATEHAGVVALSESPRLIVAERPHWSQTMYELKRRRNVTTAVKVTVVPGDKKKRGLHTQCISPFSGGYILDVFPPCFSFCPIFPLRFVFLSLFYFRTINTRISNCLGVLGPRFQ